MKWLLLPPSLDDLIRLLRAWRFWVLGALIGALIAAAVYYFAPPPYRAHATVNVDFNLEQAWPQESDRQQFYYLERETRKLEEIAWSDAVMQAIAEIDGNVTVRELRDKKLQLGQPGEAGWHFYAKDANPQRAASLASVWAQLFTDEAQPKLDAQDGLNSFIRLEVTQSADLPIKRSVPLSMYLLAGSLGLWSLSAFIILFFNISPLRVHGAGRKISI
jgi:capsular polysaccharide biosynthesis protein